MTEKSKKQKKAPPQQRKPDPEMFASPVCYAGSDELRPEFREDDEPKDQTSKKRREKKKS